MGDIKYRVHAAEYAAARRAKAKLREYCQVCCKQPKLPDRARCQDCSLRDGYVPLEDMLSGARIRVLRQIRWLEWATPGEIFSVMELQRDKRPWGFAGLTAARKRGEVERRTIFGVSEYRITERGRGSLRSVLREYESRLSDGAGE